MLPIHLHDYLWRACTKLSAYANARQQTPMSCIQFRISFSLSRCTGTIRPYNDIKNDAQWKIVHGNGGPEDSDNQDVQKLPPIRQTSNLDGLTSIYTITIKHNRISCANDCANKAIIPAGSTGAYGCYIDHNIIALCA